ncbi:hypothetical protein, partial [Pseudoalteromonas sp. MMG024]|uniref:hypothetical protein n=1 Tax=Pseudoalteromonas sp. MMG024 TaxID=2909980 RepID=UPI001F3F06A2
MVPKRLCNNVVQWHHNNQFKTNLTASCLCHRYANQMVASDNIISNAVDDTHEFYDDTHFN